EQQDRRGEPAGHRRDRPGRVVRRLEGTVGEPLRAQAGEPVRRHVPRRVLDQDGVLERALQRRVGREVGGPDHDDLAGRGRLLEVLERLRRLGLVGRLLPGVGRRLVVAGLRLRRGRGLPRGLRGCTPAAGHVLAVGARAAAVGLRRILVALFGLLVVLRRRVVLLRVVLLRVVLLRVVLLRAVPGGGGLLGVGRRRLVLEVAEG